MWMQRAQRFHSYISFNKIIMRGGKILSSEVKKYGIQRLSVNSQDFSIKSSETGFQIPRLVSFNQSICSFLLTYLGNWTWAM